MVICSVNCRGANANLVSSRPQRAVVPGRSAYLGVNTPKIDSPSRKYSFFIELVDDAFRAYGRDEITILDFGCGKSYLTFVLYYYFAVKRGVRAKIIGYDLKEDVVEHCNEVAARYGYSDLHFVVADVTRDVLYREHIDMLVTLHACDVATDYALHYAISRGVEHIFSVPCCQHEVNKTIQKGGDFDILLSHGLFQERFSALLTDAIRAAVLEDEGYDVDVIEFIDFAHSPKKSDAPLSPYRPPRHQKAHRVPPSPRPIRLRADPTSLVENERQ